MALINSNVTDQNGVVVSGALVYVYGAPGSLADLEDSMGQTIANPVTTGEDGYWEAYVDDGYYTAKYYWGGRLRYAEANILAGDPPVGPNADPNLRTDLAATDGGALVGLPDGAAVGEVVAGNIRSFLPAGDDNGQTLTDTFEALLDDVGGGIVELAAGRTYRTTNLTTRPVDPQWGNFTGQSFLVPGNCLRGNGATLKATQTVNAAPLVTAYGKLLPDVTTRYAVTGTTRTATGDTTDTSTSVNITAVGSGVLAVGLGISGAGIPAGATIAKFGTFNGTSGTIFLSVAATATASGVALTALGMAAGEKVFKLGTAGDATAIAALLDANEESAVWAKWRLGDGYLGADLPETLNWGWGRPVAADTVANTVTLDTPLSLPWDGTGTNNKHLRFFIPLTGEVFRDITFEAASLVSSEYAIYGSRIYNGVGVTADNVRGINAGAGTIVVQDSLFHFGYVEGRDNPHNAVTNLGRGFGASSARGRIDHLSISNCGTSGIYAEWASDIAIGYLHCIVPSDSTTVRFRGAYAGSNSRVHIERALFEGKAAFLTHENATGGQVTFGECRVVSQAFPFVVPVPGHNCNRLELCIDGVESLYIGDRARWIERTVLLTDGMTGADEATGQLDFAAGCVIACQILFGGGAVAADFTNFRIGRPSSMIDYVSNLVPASASTTEVNAITAYTWGVYIANETRVQMGTASGAGNWAYLAERARVRIVTPAGTTLAGSGKFVTVRMLIVPDNLATPLANTPNLGKQTFDPLAMLLSLKLTVAKLPAASAALEGRRGYVTDSNATLAAGLGNTVAGGGTDKTPVWCDGSNWKIG